MKWMRVLTPLDTVIRGPTFHRLDAFNQKSPFAKSPLCLIGELTQPLWRHRGACVGLGSLRVLTAITELGALSGSSWARELHAWRSPRRAR